jgi:hypothetical protein
MFFQVACLRLIPANGNKKKETVITVEVSFLFQKFAAV